MTGFLIGFQSQSDPETAYIHFSGVHPDFRKMQIGKQLYDVFIETVKQRGCTRVKCVTSPVNKVSIAYHTKLGFDIEKGTKTVNGISVFANYDGPTKTGYCLSKTYEGKYDGFFIKTPEPPYYAVIFLLSKAKLTQDMEKRQSGWYCLRRISLDF